MGGAMNGIARKAIKRNLRMPAARFLLTLAGAAALIASLAVVTATAGASTKVGVSHVSEVNISDQSFSVSFITSNKVSKAVMLIGTSCKAATTRAPEMKGSNGFVHLVDAPGGLNPSSTYWIKLRLDGTAYGACFRMHTYRTSSVPPPPDAIFGRN